MRSIFKGTQDSEVTPWQISLRKFGAEQGKYSCEIWDYTNDMHAGPFSLQFPSNEYAMDWFNSVSLPGTQDPSDPWLALAELEDSSVSASIDSKIWATVVSTLFHSIGPVPCIATQWWRGEDPPFRNDDPLFAETPNEPAVIRENIELFIDPDTHEIGAIRRRIDPSSEASDFGWWILDSLSSEPPRTLVSGNTYDVRPVSAEYVSQMSQLVDLRASFPVDFAPFFATAVRVEVKASDFNQAALDAISRITRNIKTHKKEFYLESPTPSLDSWIAGEITLDAVSLAKILHMGILANHMIEREKAQPEDQAVYEILTGPENGPVFALRRSWWSFNEKTSQWKLKRHEWRVKGDWVDSLPLDVEDWRWLSEVNRLTKFPELVSERHEARSATAELGIEWNVSEATRIQPEYVERFLELFDAHLTLLGGIAKTLEPKPDVEFVRENIDQDDHQGALLSLQLLKYFEKKQGLSIPMLITEKILPLETASGPVTAEDVFSFTHNVLLWRYDESEWIKANDTVSATHIGGVESPTEIIGFERLIKFVAALVALTADVVVINVLSERYPDGVYVQMCREDDGALTLEAVSSKYLDSPLTPDEITKLESLGWEFPREDDGLPNYTMFLEPDETAPGDVAKILVLTLAGVYGTTPSDRHQFEPNDVVRSLLRGDHGQEFAVNPNHSTARQARLYLGLSFPGDLNPSWQDSGN
jgi:hypothetical protein